MAEQTHHSDNDYEKEMFGSMSRSEKINHIFTYYKFHILIGILLIAVICGIGYKLLHKTPDAYLNIIDLNCDPTIADGLEENTWTGYLTGLGLSTEDYDFSIDKELTIDASNPSDYYSSQDYMIFSAYAQAGSMDLVISDQAAFEYLGEQGYFLNVDEYLDQETLETYADKLITCHNDEYNEDYVCGILLDDSATAENFAPGEPTVVGILYSAPNPDQAADYIRYLLEN